MSQVPSDAGVFAVMDGGDCLLVSDSWNLKARLLDLINALSGEENLTVTWEICAEAECEERVRYLTQTLMRSPQDRQLNRDFTAASRTSAP